MGNPVVGVVRLAAAVLTAGLFVCSGCSAPTAADIARPELLTVEEVFTADSAKIYQIPPLRLATGSGPDRGVSLPTVEEGGDPNLTGFERDEQVVALGVWDEEGNLYALAVDYISKNMHEDICLKGPFSNEGETVYSFDWRVYPLDFGEGIAAFRSVEWSQPGGGTLPPEPSLGDGMQIYSTARAYGIVNGKLVMVRISNSEPEPPSELELRALWDAQVAKVRFHDAVVRNHEVQSSQNASVDNPVSQ